MNNRKIIQIFHPYHLWEDYKAGMYQTPCEVYDVNITNCMSLLSNPGLFYEVMNKLVVEWKYATEVNLTNIQCNRKAWLGAAACCFYLGQEEVITRLAWGKLCDKKQNIANGVADKIIFEYERRNNKIHKNLGESLLF